MKQVHVSISAKTSVMTLLLLTLPLSIGVSNIAPQIFPRIGSVSGTGATILGLDCGLGTTQATIDPNTGVPTPDGVLDSACTWVGDIDGDGVFDPLVSDNPQLLPPDTGGGFTLDVRVTGLNTAINAFDISVSHDKRYLNAVVIDQSGLVFGGAGQDCFTAPATCSVFTLVKSIDSDAGVVRVAQVLLGTSTGGGPLGDGRVDQTFFRVRFDVVGIGIGSLSISNDIIATPDPLPHKTQSGSMDSSSVYDLAAGASLNWNVSWAFSPSPPIPGQPLTLTASASCQGCMGSLSYAWDFNSDGTGEATGSTQTITAPPPVAHRVTLTVTNGTVTASAVRRLPLRVSVTGPSSISVESPQNWDALWLGGIPNYTGSWRFCPGTITVTTVCSKPAPTVPSTPGQTNAVTSVVYHYSGLYNNSLRITDTASQQISPTATSTTQYFLVNVTGTPQAFSITVSSSIPEPLTGQTVNFAAAVSYDASYPSSFRSSRFKYTFDFGDGTSTTVTSTATAGSDKSYNSSGTYIVRITAEEASAAAVSRIREVGRMTITVFPPITGNINLDLPSPTSGQAASFTADVSGGVPPFTYAWDFGDGTTGTGQTVSHTYASGGTYEVKVTITDSRGNVQTSIRSVQVSAAPFPTSIIIAIGVGAIIAAAAAIVLVSRRRKPGSQTV